MIPFHLYADEFLKENTDKSLEGNGKKIILFYLNEHLPVLTNLKVTLLWDFKVSLRLGWVQSLSIPCGVAMAGAGLREPPRAPRQPNMLRSLLFPVAAETKVTTSDKSKICELI